MVKRLEPSVMDISIHSERLAGHFVWGAHRSCASHKGEGSDDSEAGHVLRWRVPITVGRNSMRGTQRRELARTDQSAAS